MTNSVSKNQLLKIDTIRKILLKDFPNLSDQEIENISIEMFNFWSLFLE